MSSTSKSSQSKLNKDDIGLYRDDGPTCFKNNNGHQTIKLGKT